MATTPQKNKPMPPVTLDNVFTPKPSPGGPRQQGTGDLGKLMRRIQPPQPKVNKTGRRD